jgi:thiamine pyrophosphate-dependent acetolactate synthase large subunit-like protein
VTCFVFFTCTKLHSALVAELGRREFAGSGWRSVELAEQLERGAWQSTPYSDAGDDAHIDPRTLSAALDTRLPIERTVAIDSGHFMGYPAMYLRVPDEHAFVFTQAFQAVGLGLASAIGAAVARPDRLTVAALGDGHHYGPHGHPLDLVQFPDVDFAALGRALGLRGATVRRADDLQAVTDWLAAGAAPGLVVDAKVVPTVVAEWLEEAFRGH